MARQPRRWRTSAWLPAGLDELVGARSHERQIDVYLAAPVKADAHAALVRAGLRADWGRGSPESLRVDQSVPGRLLEEAGLISSDPVVTLRSVKDMPIVRLPADGDPHVVGHWRYELRDRQLRIERVRRQTA